MNPDFMSKLALSGMSNDGETNAEERRRRIKNLVKCMENELTPKERQVIVECVMGGRIQCELAKELGVNKSSVSRAKKRAIKRLSTFAKYM